MLTENLGRIMPITGYGHPALRQQTLPADNNMATKMVVADLLTTFGKIHTAVGLAAPQINYGLSLFVYQPNRFHMPIVVINPIINKSDLISASEEGCLSIPGIFERVKRPQLIDVEYYDQGFNKQKRRLRGFEAVVFQHEYDHLNGILFTDHLDPQKKELIKDRLANIESGKTTTYYDMIFR